jgi:hypothetical protein
MIPAFRKYRMKSFFNFRRLITESVLSMEIASTGPQSLRSEYNTDTEVTEYVTEVTEYVTNSSSTASNSTIDMAAGEEAARRLWLTAENGADDQEDGDDDQEDGDDLNNNNNNKNDGDGMEGLDDGGGGQKEKDKGEKSADPSPTPSPPPSSHDYAVDIAESALQQLVM